MTAPVRHDELAVEHDISVERPQPAHDLRELVGERAPVTRQQPHVARLYHRERPEAVQLVLEHPAGGRDGSRAMRGCMRSAGVTRGNGTAASETP